VITLTAISMLNQRLKVDAPEMGINRDCRTMAQAISEYEMIFGVRIQGDTKEKCYRMSSEGKGLKPTLIDIQVIRGKQKIASNGNVDFPLKDGDLLRLCYKLPG